MTGTPTARLALMHQFDAWRDEQTKRFGEEPIAREAWDEAIARALSAQSPPNEPAPALAKKWEDHANWIANGQASEFGAGQISAYRAAASQLRAAHGPPNEPAAATMGGAGFSACGCSWSETYGVPGSRVEVFCDAHRPKVEPPNEPAELPALPEPTYALDHSDDTFTVPGESKWTGRGSALRSVAYTAEQMQAYAREYLLWAVSDASRLPTSSSKEASATETARPDETRKQPQEPAGWIPVSERLPELGQPVALVCIDRWENCRFERNVQECGYLENYGSGNFWSTRSASNTLESFTHWMPLPAAPSAAQVKEKS